MNREKPTIRFELGAPVEKALGSSSEQFGKDCKLGICLYKYSLSFSRDRRATVLMNPKTTTSLNFEDAVSVTLGTDESDIVNDAEITLGGVSPNSPHAQAMGYFYQRVDNLLAQGWHRFIMPNEARIPGLEAKKFESTSRVLSKPVGTGPWLDPSLKLNLEEWLSLPMFNDWYFYKDGIYLILSMQRENSADSPREKGSYLFTLNARSESEFYKEFVASDDRDDWLKLIPEELKRMAQERAQTEARLKQMGIAIDENYQDPPIKALE